MVSRARSRANPTGPPTPTFNPPTPHTAQEVRGIIKARKLGIPTPVIYDVDASTACLTMERVAGRTLKAVLQSPTLDAPGTAVWRAGAREGRVC